MSNALPESAAVPRRHRSDVPTRRPPLEFVSRPAAVSRSVSRGELWDAASAASETWRQEHGLVQEPPSPPQHVVSSARGVKRGFEPVAPLQLDSFRFQHSEMSLFKKPAAAAAAPAGPAAAVDRVLIGALAPAWDQKGVTFPYPLTISSPRRLLAQ